jgi:hypothetical protein
LVHKIEIQDPWLGTKNQDSVAWTGIRNTLIQTENGEDPTGIEISTIRSRTKNMVNPIGTEILMTRSKTKTELPIENMGFARIVTLAKITKSVNTSQILDPNIQELIPP